MDDRTYLEHILDAIGQIFQYTQGGKEVFLADRKIQDAVIRNFEIIGEAAKHISSAVRQKHPEIPFKPMAGMRDEMIHEYFGVDLKLVWRVIEKELPALKSKIGALLLAI